MSNHHDITPMTATTLHICTDQFKLPASKYMHHVLSLWLSRHWWLAIVPFATLVLSFSNIAWAYVSLIIVMMIYPTAMMMVYYNYALTRHARLALYRQRLVIGGDTIEQHFVADEQFEAVPAVQIYDTTDVKQLSINGKTLTIDMAKPRYHHLSVPIEAMSDDDVQSLKLYFGTKFAF